jgi:hypothetical protein
LTVNNAETAEQKKYLQHREEGLEWECDEKNSRCIVFFEHSGASERAGFWKGIKKISKRALAKCTLLLWIDCAVKL